MNEVNYLTGKIVINKLLQSYNLQMNTTYVSLEYYFHRYMLLKLSVSGTPQRNNISSLLKTIS